MADIATKEINGFYSRYATKEGITLAEAKRRISTADIAEYAKKAEKYVPDKDLSDKANEEMRLYNAMMSINRLEMLKSSIGLGMVEGFDELDQAMQEHLTEAAMAEFERQAGILGATVRDPRAAARTIVNSSFHNATFSERIWMHQDMLRSELDKLLQEGLIKGESSLKLARHLQKAFGASQRDAERLMRTEMSRVYTEAQKESYEDAGYEDYTYIALGDACEICSPLDGKHFKVKQMRVGENAPPMHPNCRCSTAPWMDRQTYYDNLIEDESSNIDISGSDSMAFFAGVPFDSYRIKKNDDNHNDLHIVNVGYPKEKARKKNCFKCVAAYEARMRGKDVIAQPVQLDEKGRIIYGEAEKHSYDYLVGLTSRLRSAGSYDGKEFIARKLQDYGDGARVQVFVTWGEGTTKYITQNKEVEMPSSHTFIAENHSGIIRFIDPQTGSEDCSDYFTKVKNGATIFARTDDLDINEDVIDLFITNRGGK